MQDIARRPEPKETPRKNTIITMNGPVYNSKVQEKQDHLDRLFRPHKQNLLHSKMPSGIWKGRRCFLIGGGPSLKGFDFSQLKGELVITVNRAFEDCSWSAINICQDARVFGWYEGGDLGEEARKKFASYKGYKTWLNVQAFPFPEDIYQIDLCHVSDFNYKNYSGGIPPHGNSGLNALCVAACLGADPIYLLGFDMKGSDKHTANYHKGYPTQDSDNVYPQFIQDFKNAMGAFNPGSRVINLNPDSALRCFPFGRFEDLPKIKRPIVASFFTKGTGYEQEIKRLEESCIRYGFEYDFLPAENKGTWRKNIHARIQILMDFLNKPHGRDILYIDADGAIINYPTLFDNFQEDFGAVYMDREKYMPKVWNKEFYGEAPGGKWEILGGTMYLKNNIRVRKMLEKWEELDAPMNTYLSQVHLPNAIKAVPDLKIRKLPDGYCQIFDIMAEAGEPIIEHYQASRRSLLSVKC